MESTPDRARTTAHRGFRRGSEQERLFRGHAGGQTADGDAQAVARVAQGVDAPEVTDDANEGGDVGFTVKERGVMDVDFLRQRDTGEAETGGMRQAFRVRGASTPVDSLEDGNAEEEAEELGRRVAAVGTEKRRTRKEGRKRRGLSEGPKSGARLVMGCSC
ncbi:hypothetical protein C8R45DRAFT_940875 [Mycena sanguinolenta]|nr:hypothetical protein C8R45DRAFT_940875 [Mycena sanguinolenta]